MKCSYSNDCSPFCQFYSNLKTPQNGRHTLKGIVSRKTFNVVASVVYLVSITKSEQFLVIFLNHYGIQLLNHCSPFCQFYSDLKIFQNGKLLIKA